MNPCASQSCTGFTCSPLPAWACLAVSTTAFAFQAATWPLFLHTAFVAHSAIVDESKEIKWTTFLPSLAGEGNSLWSCLYTESWANRAFLNHLYVIAVASPFLYPAGRFCLSLNCWKCSHHKGQRPCPGMWKDLRLGGTCRHDYVGHSPFVLHHLCHSLLALGPRKAGLYGCIPTRLTSHPHIRPRELPAEDGRTGGQGGGGLYSRAPAAPFDSRGGSSFLLLLVSGWFTILLCFP